MIGRTFGLVTIAIAASAMPALDAQTFKCTTADAVRGDKGRFVRDNVTRRWSVNGYKTIVVDTAIRSNPIEFIFIMNGFSVYTGTCEALY